mgnify:CR=1 FL=1
MEPKNLLVFLGQPCTTLSGNKTEKKFDAVRFRLGQFVSAFGKFV